MSCIEGAQSIPVYIRVAGKVPGRVHIPENESSSLSSAMIPKRRLLPAKTKLKISQNRAETGRSCTMICSVWRYPLYRQDLPQEKVYCNCRTDSSILDPGNEGAAACSIFILGALKMIRFRSIKVHCSGQNSVYTM